MNKYIFKNYDDYCTLIIADQSDISYIRNEVHRGEFIKEVLIAKSVKEFDFRDSQYLAYAKKVFVHKENVNFKVMDNHLYSSDGRILYKYSSNSKKDKIIIPEGIEVIDSFAVSFDNNVKELVLPKSLKVICKRAIYECNKLEKIYIDENVYCIHSQFELFNNLKFIEVSEKNLNYKSINGDLYIKDGTFICRYAYGKNDKVFVSPKELKEIGANSFMYAEHLTDVVLNKEISLIEEYAFASCFNLREIELPKINKIYEKSFEYCSNLKKVIIPNSVRVIEKGAFEWCDSIENIELPSSIKKVEEQAFACCKSLVTVEVSASTKLHAFAFVGSLNVNIVVDGKPKKEIICYNNLFEEEVLPVKIK